MKGITIKFEDLSIGNSMKMVGLRPISKRRCLTDLTLEPCKHVTCYKTKWNVKSIPKQVCYSNPLTIQSSHHLPACHTWILFHLRGVIPRVHGAHVIILADSAVELPNAVTLRLSANRCWWLVISISKYLYRILGDSFLLQMVKSPHAFSPSHFKTYISSLAYTFSDRKFRRDHFAVNQCWRRSF